MYKKLYPFIPLIGIYLTLTSDVDDTGLLNPFVCYGSAILVQGPSIIATLLFLSNVIL